MSSRTAPSATSRSNRRRKPRSLMRADASRRRHGVLVMELVDNGCGALGAQAALVTASSFCELRSSSAKRSQACAAARGIGGTAADAPSSRHSGCGRRPPVRSDGMSRAAAKSGNGSGHLSRAASTASASQSRQNFGIGPLRHDDARGLPRRRTARHALEAGELLRAGDRRAQSIVDVQIQKSRRRATPHPPSSGAERSRPRHASSMRPPGRDRRALAQEKSIAQHRLVLVAARDPGAGGGGLEREAAAPHAGEGHISADARVENGEGGAGPKGGLGLGRRRHRGAPSRRDGAEVSVQRQ